MAKNIDDCQTPNEVADAIGEFLRHGGSTVLKEREEPRTGIIKSKVERDVLRNTRFYGRALSRYNEL